MSADLMLTINKLRNIIAALENLMVQVDGSPYEKIADVAKEWMLLASRHREHLITQMVNKELESTK